MANNEELSEVGGDPLVTITNNDKSTKSVFSYIEQGLLKSPHLPAVICMHQPADHMSDLVPNDEYFQQPVGGERVNYLTLTYTQLHRAALVLAAGMMENGARPGSTIITLIPNGGEYAMLFWACMIMRITVAALDPSMLNVSRASELRNLIGTLKPGTVVVPSLAGARAVDHIIESLALEKPLRISLGVDFANGWNSLLDLAADGSKSPIGVQTILEEARRDDPDRIHSILFTSGTSAGQPKGCPQRVGSAIHILHSQSWLINQDNCTLVLQQAHNSRAIAPQHTLQVWGAGGAVVMAGASFAIEDTIDAITNHKVTFIVLSPAMVHDLANYFAAHPGKLASVQTVQVGGDAITKGILTKCTALFPKARVCINHGMTEGGGFFMWPFFETPVSQIPYFGEICPIGTVAAGTRLRIWDADRGSLAKRGEPGELHICCESIVRNYLGGAAASSFYEDGQDRWFITGDIAMLNTESLVFILGRSKDVIKRAGVAIMPAALESCIEQYTGAQVSIKNL